MVDGTRLDDAEKALLGSKDRFRQVQNVILGLSNQSLIKAIRENRYLMAVFAFIAGCTVLSAQKVGRLLYEIVQRRHDTSIHSHQIVRIVEQIQGYKDFFSESAPFDVYDRLAKAFWDQAIQQSLRIDSVYDDTDAGHLAELIVKVIDAMTDTDNKRVLVKGSRMGIWLACLFVWIRPNEVDVFVGGVRIYPEVSDDSSTNDRRMSIIFTESEQISNLVWRLEAWKDIQGQELQELVVDMSDSRGVRYQHQSPLQNTRNHIAVASRVRSELLDCIGDLATALICIAVDKGELHHPNPLKHHPVVALSSVCSRTFLEGYPNMMAHFGWDSIDKARVSIITNSLMNILNHGLQTVGPLKQSTCFWTQLESMIKSAARDNQIRTGKWFLSTKKDTEDDYTIIEFAIHLATEALFFSVCEKRPTSAVYRPLEPGILNRNANLLFALAFSSLGTAEKVRCTYSDFMNHAWKAMVQSAEDIAVSDLAVSVGGYVIYRSLFDHLDSGVITDRRVAAGATVRPGSLKLQGTNGRYFRLVEDIDDETRSSFPITRFHQGVVTPVDLLAPDNTFRGISDADAIDRAGASVKHTIHATNDSTSKLQIITHIHRSSGSSTGTGTNYDRFPASWESSIYAVVYAHHCKDTQYVPMRQMELLIEEWHNRGYLGEGLQWCSIGRDARDVMRGITKTQNQEALRFFEAGSIASYTTYRFFIRPSTMPLLYCVIEALKESDDGCIIIA
ncbi:hypothetical protein PG997_007292 [Apiospora hydei]|uniref:Uncharacterized protein n=1 Tax=Apiospora hydei TaxID=1337664 RepID=A0ABR1WBB3_9PEZI